MMGRGGLQHQQAAAPNEGGHASLGMRLREPVRMPCLC